MIQELTWDTGFFGRKIGKIIAIPTDEGLNELLAQAGRQQFRYLTCRVKATEIFAVQILEKHGFYLTDIGIIWERDVGIIETPQILAKDGTPEDSGTIKKIAAGLFKESRLYHDRFFTNEEAERFYQTWAENSLKGFADKVFLIEDKGFITCKVSGDTGDIPLIGVSVAYQGRGIGTALVLNALKWFKERKVNNVTVRTQSGNINAIKFYQHLGFKLKAVDITMGKILTPAKFIMR